jgi:chorismate mutase
MKKNIKYQFSNDWIKKINKPLVISGPCSAESEDQMLKTAKKMDKNYIHFFRAGVWKPRTKPNNFDGVGSIGLKWLQKVKNETGMMVATEVANSYHAKESLKYDIDLLWIGARSTVNPFTVQEIAESLKGTEKIVLVKNPTHIDMDLWIGALERLIEQGINNIGVIHRGFSTYNNVKYRNQPYWDLIIDLKNKYPNLPIFCDPSHISGKREGIEYILRKSMYFKYDGFMVETHYNPNKAWSDSKQQITPEELLKLIKSLTNKKNTNYVVDVTNKIKMLRTQIDEIDQNIISLVAKRSNISKQIGMVKKQNNINVFQPDRWDNILKKILTLSKKLYLSKNYIKRIFNLIHEESINIQNKMINKK